MSHNIQLECYTFRLKERRENYYLPLDNYVSTRDFYRTFQDFMASIQTMLSKDERLQKTIQLGRDSVILNSEHRTISGIIEHGEYGRNSTIKDVITGEQRYKRTRRDTDISPYYFLIYLPKESINGMLILQRTGVHGIKELFYKKLAEYINAVHPTLKAEIESYIARELIELLTQGEVHELVLRKFDPGSDGLDVYQKMGLKSTIKKVEFRITAKSDQSLFERSRLAKLLENPQKAIFDVSVKELSDLGFDGNYKKSLNIIRNGRERTIDLTDIGQLRPYYEVKELKTDEETGHPIFDSLDQYAKGLVRDFMVFQQESGN